MIDLQEIRNHATANYNKGGWYVLVECWSDQDILAFCQKFDLKETNLALSALEDGLSIYDDDVDV